MTDLTQRMVEAGARAMWDTQNNSALCDWDQSWITAAGPTPYDRKRYLKAARACLTAALALAEAQGGAILTVVPAELPEPQGYHARTRALGHNHCRAATLAGKVTLPARPEDAK